MSLLSRSIVAEDFHGLQFMEPISLNEMSAVSLMNRTDTKFVTSADILSKILDDARSEGYRVCQIEGIRLIPYKSVYFDTHDLYMFTAHRNKKSVRQKVRVRTYEITGQTFLEIKRKNNHLRTKKKRFPIPPECLYDFSMAEGAEDFLVQKTIWKASDLKPETTTYFDRITLVDPYLTERITLDINLRFHNLRNGRSIDLGPLVIIEVKQDAHKHSTFRKILLSHRLFPYRISKYCISVTLTDPSARYGRFKEKIRYIEKLIDRKLL